MTVSFVSLLVQDLILQVKLGCSEEERKTPQEVRVSAEIRFIQSPHGVTSDKLEDTVCYARISSAFRDWVLSREFNLVERLAHDLFGVLREIVGSHSKISLSAHKVSPPVEGLTGGVVCRVGDFD